MGRLFWKFFFAFWLSLLVAGAAVGFAVWLHNQSERDEIRLLQGGPRAAWVLDTATTILEAAGPDGLSDLLERWQRRHWRSQLMVVDDTGRDLLGRSVAPEALASARAARGADDQVREVKTASGATYLLFVTSDGEARSPRGRRPPEPSPWVPIFVGLIASIGFSVLLAWYLSKPVRHLRWAFQAAAEGRLDARVHPLMGGRRDEIADLGRDFDRMAQQLQQLIAAQRRLLHDVSHELRSPLARLQAAIGLLRQNPARLDASLERIERESERLDELVGELLTLSRLEAGGGDAPLEQLDLMDLIAAIADDARFEAEASGRRLHFEGQGEAIARVRGELMHRAFENVIRNAVKYTAEGSQVDVTASVREGVLQLCVGDRGPGLPESDLEAVFEPFHRGSNGQSAKGFGLGLAIARRAVETHGGQIRARNRDGGGLELEIMLPLQREA